MRFSGGLRPVCAAISWSGEAGNGTGVMVLLEEEGIIFFREGGMYFFGWVTVSGNESCWVDDDLTNVEGGRDWIAFFGMMIIDEEENPS